MLTSPAKMNQISTAIQNEGERKGLTYCVLVHGRRRLANRCQSSPLRPKNGSGKQRERNVIVREEGVGCEEAAIHESSGNGEAAMAWASRVMEVASGAGVREAK
jgi:hypothetical protein